MGFAKAQPSNEVYDFEHGLKSKGIKNPVSFNNFCLDL